MASEQEQKGIDVPQHKRLAQGEKLDGTSYQPKGGSEKKQGGLAHTSKKK
jgi:hypothetical protein